MSNNIRLFDVTDDNIAIYNFVLAFKITSFKARVTDFFHGIPSGFAQKSQEIGINLR